MEVLVHCLLFALLAVGKHSISTDLIPLYTSVKAFWALCLLLEPCIFTSFTFLYHLHPSPCIWTLSIWALSHSLGSVYCLLTFKTSTYSLLFLPYHLLKLLLDECWIVWIEPQCLLNVLLFSKLYLCVCLFCILACPFNFFFYNNNLVMVLSILQPFINFKKF